jgi:hypothetical protein
VIRAHDKSPSGTDLFKMLYLFAGNPRFARSSDALKSQVVLVDFRQFMSALDGTPEKINNENFRGLSQSCEEFVFQDLSAQLSQFRKSDDFKEQATMEFVAVVLCLAVPEQFLQLKNVRVVSILGCNNSAVRIWSSSATHL